MLSKSKGQVLRISAAFHVLFHVKKEVTQQVVTIRLTKTIMRNMKIKMTNTKIKMANTKTKMTMIMIPYALKFQNRLLQLL